MQSKYTITNKIVNDLGKIEACKALIENSPLVPLWERQFREEAVLRAVHHSTHVEGNPLSKDEAQRVLDGKTVYAKRDHIQEVINYRNIIEHIDSVYQDTTKPITEETVLTFHKILMQKILPADKLGKYRQSSVAVRNSKSGQVVFKPPEAEKVPELMEGFLRWLWKASKENLNPVIKAGIIHYNLVSIHPFVDGNGRTARALSTLSLYKDRYDIKRFFCLDEYFDQDSVSYYSALKETDEAKELTPWLEYFSAGLRQELERVRDKVLELSKDAKLRKTIGQIALNERQERIIMYVEKYGRIANKDWRKLFPNVSDDTILRDLRFLIDKNILRKRGKTKAAYYELR